MTCLVPVPVRSPLSFPSAIILETSSKYWCSSCLVGVLSVDPFVVAMFLKECICVCENEYIIASMSHYHRRFLHRLYFVNQRCIVCHSYPLKQRTTNDSTGPLFRCPLIFKGRLGRLSGFWCDDAQTKKRRAWSGIGRSLRISEKALMFSSAALCRCSSCCRPTLCRCSSNPLSPFIKWYPGRSWWFSWYWTSSWTGCTSSSSSDFYKQMPLPWSKSVSPPWDTFQSHNFHISKIERKLWNKINWPPVMTILLITYDIIHPNPIEASYRDPQGG